MSGRNRSRVTIVNYHHLSESSDPCVDLLDITTHPAAFERHLAYFARNYDVIGLDDLLGSRLPRRPLLITFDDHYRSVLDIAAPMLARRGMPAVWFINPGLVGADGVSLENVASLFAARRGVEALCRAVARGPVVPTTWRRLLASHIALMRPAQRAAAQQALLDGLAGEGCEPVAPCRLAIEAHELAGLAGLGIEIGNHTATHVFCRALTQPEIDTEILASKAALERMSGRAVRSFSFPFGNELDATPAVLDALRRSGHAATFLVHNCSNRYRPAADIWYRISMLNEGEAALRVHLSLKPAMRTLRRAIGHAIRSAVDERAPMSAARRPATSCAGSERP